MNKSICASSFPVPLESAEGADRARQAGFTAFEPMLAGSGELTPTTGEAACRALGEQIRDTGLEIAGVTCDLFWKTTFTSPDPAIRQAARDLTNACLERARWLGAPVLHVLPGVVAHRDAPHRPRAAYADALAYAGDAFRQLAFEAEAYGVVLGLRNAWNQFLLSPVEMREFVDRISSRWVGVSLDVGAVMRYGVPADWIDHLGRRIVRVHVRDFKLSVGTADGFCLPGDGDVDWLAVLAALDRIGYDGPLTYLGPGDPAEAARRLDRLGTAG